MKIVTIKELLGAEVLCNEDKLDCQVYSACGSDMMSNVLAYVEEEAILLTGLINSQVIRTAEMMDMVCVVFVRGKIPTPEMVELARVSGIVLLITDKTMFETCGILYENGLRGRVTTDHE